MGTVHDTVSIIRRRVSALGPGRWLLAVSGGIDSMVLLAAAADSLDRGNLTVATFDHGTGPAATTAATLVGRTARELGVICVAGRARTAGRTESEWRDERWAFLRTAARGTGSRVVTAHTLDDQVETVFIRALRGAGPRGLAGLYAQSPVARPLIGTTRAEIQGYAAAQNIVFVTDPSNADLRHLRNRVRLQLLPAMERTSPGFRRALLEIAEKASGWRAQMEALALTFPMMSDSPQNHSFQRSSLRGFPAESLKSVWPALSARAGVVLDRRGTDRLAAFTIEGETGQQIQLSGGVTVQLDRQSITFRTTATHG